MSRLDPNRPISQALDDAAVRCERAGEIAVITLRSGVQMAGILERPVGGNRGVRVQAATNDGWCVALIEDISAVGINPAPSRVPRNKPDLQRLP